MENENVKTKTWKSYERIAPLWAKGHQNPDFWLKWFKKFQVFLPNGRVIDMGCGAGRDAALFLPAGYEYVGIDNSEA